MKTFYRLGNNPQNKGGVSWKIWKIQRTGQTVTTRWGPAEVRGRKVVTKGRQSEKTRRFVSSEAAQAHEQRRIQGKLRKGYERKPRRR